MTKGGKFLVATAILAVAACSMDRGKLEVRSTPSAIARGAKPVPERIAEARGQIALGNVALALEAFRKASRDDPNSIDALAGIANCYDRMGRFDLSRRYYESALALAPADAQLLGAFAASLQLQGRTVEALRVRQEIAARSAAATAVTEPAPQIALRSPDAPPAPAVVLMSAVTPSATALPPSLLATNYAMAPADLPAPAPEPALAPRQFAVPEVAVEYAPDAGRLGVSVPATEYVELRMEAPQVAAASAAPVQQTPPIGRSVTVKLPPARRAEPAAPTVTASAELPPLKPYSRPVPQPALASEQGPRLERLSMGEIALITTSGPVWQSATVAHDRRSATVRFIPLREASTVPVKVRLLNAARVDRLAARTRNWLLARGWRGLAIGDAYATRNQSLVLYPADKRWLAQRVAAQFGFAIAPSSSSRHIVVLLGSDAARHPALRPSRA